MKKIVVIWGVGCLLACESGEVSSNDGRQAGSALTETQDQVHESKPSASHEGEKPKPLEASTSSDPEEVPNDHDAVSLPASVAGAFLACAYAKADQVVIKCQLEGVPERGVQIGKVEFYKILNSGAEIPLLEVVKLPGILEWEIKETTATVAFRRIRATIEWGDLETRAFDQKLPPLVEHFSGDFMKYFIGHAGFPNSGEPSNVGEKCVVMGTKNRAQWITESVHNLTYNDNERLNDVPCLGNFRFLCRSLNQEEPVFLVSDYESTFDDYKAACPEGYIFSFPFSDQDYHLARTAIDSTMTAGEVWLSIHVPPGGVHPKEGGHFAPLEMP